MGMIVVVDDERTFQGDDVDVYLRTENEALAWFARWYTADARRPIGATEAWIDELWLDHDLGDEQDVMSVVHFLSSISRGHRLPIRKILIHTQNPVGAANMHNWCMGIADTDRVGLPVLA